MPQPGTPLLGSGRLSRRVVVERDTGATTPDSYGNLVPDYQPFITRWARVEYLGGSEQVVNNQVVAERKHKITLHDDAYTRQITPEMRIRLDGRTLNIVAVDRIPEQQTVVIHTREIVQGAN